MDDDSYCGFAIVAIIVIIICSLGGGHSQYNRGHDHAQSQMLEKAKGRRGGKGGRRGSSRGSTGGYRNQRTFDLSRGGFGQFGGYSGTGLEFGRRDRRGFSGGYGGISGGYGVPVYYPAPVTDAYEEPRRDCMDACAVSGKDVQNCMRSCKELYPVPFKMPFSVY